jgi:hypothetical protein
MDRVDATGMVSVGESGSVLAQTRTRPFDVRPRHTYVAPCKPCRRHAPALALLMAGVLQRKQH